MEINNYCQNQGIQTQEPNLPLKPTFNNYPSASGNLQNNCKFVCQVPSPFPGKSDSCQSSHSVSSSMKLEHVKKLFRRDTSLIEKLLVLLKGLPERFSGKPRIDNTIYLKPGHAPSTQLTRQDGAKEYLWGLAEKHVSDPVKAENYKSAIDSVFNEFSVNKESSSSSSNFEGGSDLLDNVTGILDSIGIDYETAKGLVKTVLVWKQLNSSEKISSAGSIGVGVLENLGVLNKEKASDYQGAVEALSIFINPEASGRDRALAGAAALAQLTTTSLTGTVDLPETVGGKQVVGCSEMGDGSPGFLLDDGDLVSRSDLVTTSNVTSALQALAVLTSDTEDEDKALALGQIGLQAGTANEIISDVNAGRISAALSIFNTVSNWDEMNDGERISSTIQTASTTLSALESIGSSGAASAGSSVGSSTASSAAASSGSLAGSVASGAASVAGIVIGVKQAVDVFDALGDLNRSQGVKVGALGVGTAGAAIGAGVGSAMLATGAAVGSVVPVVGTVIGAVVGAAIGAIVGACGSGKSSFQKARDGWREAMEAGGFAKKIDGSHHVKLADGTTYNIGRDGGSKLVNLDGSERHTYEIDFANESAATSVPDAHLFAIATGLDPITNEDKGLWTLATGQALNAATSNASTVEEVRANFRAMISGAGVEPLPLALKLEVLRATNKISEQDYGVYLDRINKTFNIQLVPTNREEAKAALLEGITSQPELSEADQELLNTLIEG